jgi:hypothetical protein
MVELGCLPDDSDEYVIYSHYLPTIHDKENPRIEVEVIDLSGALTENEIPW